MPLTFLVTDDSSGDERPRPETALPYDAPETYFRPYRPGPYRVAGGALLLLLASYLLFAALIFGVSGALPTTGTITLMAALVITFALRLLRTGIWVNGRGLRQTSVLRTVTVPWERIASVGRSQQPVRWLGLPRLVQGQAVLVTRVDGAALRPVLTDHNADFLGREEAFDKAADRVRHWFTHR